MLHLNDREMEKAKEDGRIVTSSKRNEPRNQSWHPDRGSL